MGTEGHKVGDGQPYTINASFRPKPKANMLDRFVSWMFPKLRCRVDGIPHDYKVRNGGDGFPCHFSEYTCWKCGERFGI